MDPDIGNTGGGCSELEPYALRVIGDSMAPEFWDGCIVIVEPRMTARSGQYVVADYAGETTFRQYVEENGQRYLKPLNDKFETVPVQGNLTVRGVVIQRAGARRSQHKHYDNS